MSEEQKVNWINKVTKREHGQISIREKQWKFQKETLTKRISSLQTQLRTNQLLSQDLVHRIKVLQVALKDERMNKNGKSTLQSQQIKQLVETLKIESKVQNTHNDFLQQIIKDMDLFHQQPSRPVQAFSLPEPKGKHKKITSSKAVGAHLDVITSLANIKSNQQLLATASQDCLIKIWSVENLLHQENPEPKNVLRKHTGPVFSMTVGPNPAFANQNLLFSAGIEGDIKSWAVNQKGVEWRGSWPSGCDQDQTIWQLSLLQGQLLSSSSDGVIRLFGISAGTGGLQLKLSGEFIEKQFMQNGVSWINSDTFIAGCSSAPRIHLWNTNGKLVQKYLFQTDKNLFIGVGDNKNSKKGLYDTRQAACFQINKLAYSKDTKLILAGCQDSALRFFDYASSSMQRKVQLGSAVTALAVRGWQVVAGQAKGDVSIIDLRTFGVVQQLKGVHQTKYETGVTGLCIMEGFLGSSGADGIVKIHS